MTKPKMQTPDLIAQNIEWVAARFPGCITESRNEKGEVVRAVDFDLLRQELSAEIAEGPRERYHLDWPGKREALLAANAPIAKTLRPRPQESVNFDKTRHIFIEGDNLDALKLLQETYLGRIKVIYIDPPYNTGGDFLYDDRFASSSSDYLVDSEQRDIAGDRLVSNTESNGRFHSAWLSMMYPRLRVARTLLREDGAIFVSIGIEELATLRLLMGEVFGDGNFVEVFSWVKTSTPPALSTKSRKTVEYIVCFERNKTGFRYQGDLLDGGDQPLLNRGNKEGVLQFPASVVEFKTDSFPDGPLAAHSVERVELLDDIVIHKGRADRDFRLKSEFKWTQAFLNDEIARGTRFIVKSEQLSIRFIRDEDGFKRPTNLIKDESLAKVISKPATGVETNESATAALQDLFGADVFDHPKPVSLIAYLCRLLSSKDDLICDFFAGSGTTAEAVMRLNATDGGARRFILVQLDEAIDPARLTDSAARERAERAIALLGGLGVPANVAELCKERIRRAAKAIAAESQATQQRGDLGFRVVKVDSSNMKDVYYRPDEATPALLGGHVDNIKDDRSDDDLLFQVLLDWGVDLSLPIKKETISGKPVYFVDENALAACFAAGIDEALVKALAARKPLRAVFRDAGYGGDDVKINVEQIFKQLSPGTEVKTL